MKNYKEILDFLRNSIPEDFIELFMETAKEIHNKEMDLLFLMDSYSGYNDGDYSQPKVDVYSINPETQEVYLDDVFCFVDKQDSDLDVMKDDRLNFLIPFFGECVWTLFNEKRLYSEDPDCTTDAFRVHREIIDNKSVLIFTIIPRSNT